LTSTVGTRGVRDPSIIRSHDGKKFWIIATDLKMHGSKSGWDAAGRNGSKSIVIWESSDLRKWTGPRLARVSSDSAGNTWAPEAVWDGSRGEYMVFWASALYDSKDAAHKGNSYYRVMKASTKDFVTFSAPEVWIDKRYSVIDTTLVWDENGKKWYRFTKDERPNNKDNSPNGKFIFQEWAPSLGAKDWNMVRVGIGKGVIKQGEGPTVVKSNTVPGKVCCLFGPPDFPLF
jgi:beta-xylosidase